MRRCVDDGHQAPSIWAKICKTQFNEDPTVFSAYGHTLLGSFLRAS
jgi:branched-chain amino acid transport system substrate-binding protein